MVIATTVSPEGRVLSAEVECHTGEGPGPAWAALNAVKDWTFFPAEHTYHGKVVVWIAPNRTSNSSFKPMPLRAVG